LKENDFRVIGTDISEESVGKHFVDGFYVVPRAETGQPVIDAYRLICEKENVSWIISGPEEEIRLLAQHESIYKQINAEIFHPNADTLAIVSDKWLLADFCAKNQIGYPRTVLGEKYQAIDAVGGEFLIKPRWGRGGSGISQYNRFVFEHCLIQKSDYVIQQKVSGQELSVDVLFDRDGSILGLVPRLRLKVDSGIAVITRSVRQVDVLPIVERISSLMTFRGGCCFQFIMDPSGNYLLTDINPRLGGGSIAAIKLSKCFQSNLLYLLSGDEGYKLPFELDLKESTMFRFYDEIFVN